MKPIKAAIVSVQGTVLTDEEKLFIQKDNPLGIALFSRNIETPQQLFALTNSIKEVAERDNILIAIDQEGGRVSRLAPPHFRSYAAQAEIGSLDMTEALQMAQLHAELITDDLHKVGINCNFAPTLDVAVPFITKALKNRCFSRNINMTAALGKIMVETYSQNAVLPCIKHLPGHSGAMNDPHLQISVIRKLLKRYLYPFQQVAPHALMAMTAHIIMSEYDELPITMSKKAIKKLVRGELGFNGILISDALEMKALSGSLAEKTRLSREAGCDSVCYCMGDSAGVKTVLDNCGYLSDKAMETFAQISNLITSHYQPQNISGKVRKYNHLFQSTIKVTDDYDAVEVLHQLQKSTE
jgi:beta-N-acetylhexosaminidase